MKTQMTIEQEVRSSIQDAISEYTNIYNLALERIADDAEITDKARCARQMTEAYFRGQMDRERIAA